jgi:CheY-like chemotaxis protein
VIRGWRALAASADADQRADVQWLFNDHGCKLDVCVTGTEAWALLEKNHYDFVLLDSNLTDMDSYQLANQLRLKNTRQPIKSYVLLLTQPWEDENPQKAALAGIGHTLSKPLTDARLERVLTACATDYLDLMGEAFRR